MSHWLLRRFFFPFFPFFFLFPSLYTTAAFSRAHRRVTGMHVLVHIRSNPPGSPFRISPLVLSRRPATVSFERVTVVSRATASPTRAGTHTRTCVQRGTSAIVCEHPSPRPLGAHDSPKQARHFCAREREDWCSRTVNDLATRPLLQSIAPFLSRASRFPFLFDREFCKFSVLQVSRFLGYGRKRSRSN